MKSISELMDLTGRRAFVTGALGGIGEQIAFTLYELGADLLLIDQPGADFHPLVEKLRNKGIGSIFYFDCDLENEQSRQGLIDKLLMENLPLHILINNAAFVGTSGLSGWVTDFHDQSVETWRRAIEVNLTAAFHLCKGLSPLLYQSQNGSIVNVSSIYGLSAPDYSLYEDTKMGNPAAYAASKGGLLQLTRWLSSTLAPGIRVNAVSPGGVWRNQPENFVRKYKLRTPLGRMATEEDFKGCIAFLCSDMSAYITGQNIVVDGGWTVW